MQFLCTSIMWALRSQALINQGMIPELESRFRNLGPAKLFGGRSHGGRGCWGWKKERAAPRIRIYAAYPNLSQKGSMYVRFRRTSAIKCVCMCARLCYTRYCWRKFDIAIHGTFWEFTQQFLTKNLSAGAPGALDLAWCNGAPVELPGYEVRSTSRTCRLSTFDIYTQCSSVIDVCVKVC